MLEHSAESLISSKERVKLAINHKQTDRVPKGELLIEEEFIAQTLNSEDVTFADKLEFVTRLKLDIISLHPTYPILSGNLPPLTSILWSNLKDWVNQSSLFSFAVIDGLLGWGNRVFGYKDFLFFPKKSPLAFEDFSKKVIALNVQLAENLIAQGINGLIIADDLAHRQGLLFNPEITKRYFLSALATLVERISPAGIPIFFHSDGNLNSIMQNIVDIGFQGLHCIDKNSGMDVIQLQRDYGQKLTLWGSLSVEDLIQSRDQGYREELIQKITLLNANKGFILGTDSGLFPGIDFADLAKIYMHTF